MTGEGWALERGATVHADGSTYFSVWAPKLKAADVVVRTGDRQIICPLERAGSGVFDALVPDVAPGADYFYRLDGSRERPDPVSRHQPAGVHGPSRVIDPHSYRWGDAEWKGIERADLVLYELHVGCFSEPGTFDAVAERLSYLRDLGVTALELMPVAEFPGRRNWGYDGVSLYAPHNGYGGPEGLRRLVDAAHAEGLAVYLDVVYNHLGPEGNYLAEFGPYSTRRHSTPWGNAINFDGPGSDEVRRYFIDNALYWIKEFHIDGLRLDAVQAIFDMSPLHILAELGRAAADMAAACRRPIHVIAESDLNDPRLVRTTAAGGFELGAMWSDDFHHAVHAWLTGERNGYYADFGGVEPVARALQDRFVLHGSYSIFHQRRHGADARDLPSDRFVVYVQNHDQVGNRAEGERLSCLVSNERQKLAAALLLLSPYIPLLFMGEEYGERHPFLYFVDHSDANLLETVRQGRREIFERFAWRGPMSDPADESTFLRSRLGPWQIEEAPNAQLFQLYRDLIHARQKHEALRPGTATTRVSCDPGASTLAIHFESEGDELLAVFNLSEEPQAVELAATVGRWRCELATDDPKYGGSGQADTSAWRSDGKGLQRLTVGGSSAALYVREAE